MCIEDFMQQIRRQRLDAEREAVLTVRFQALKAAVEAHYVSLLKTADMDHRPQAIDFAFTDECRALLDVPDSEPVCQQDLDDFVSTLAPKLVEEHKRALEEALRPHLPPADADGDSDVLNLALAVFPCERCNVFFRYPAILAHPCAYPSPSHISTFKRTVYERAAARALKFSATTYSSIYGGCGPFSSKKMFDSHSLKRAVASMSSILEALELDPRHATLEELNNYDARFSCKMCYRHRDAHNTTQTAYTWSGAVSAVGLSCMYEL